MSDELTSRKIHPRNLTARADHWVRGNSILTRPESGVDNSFPGLEFDQRNLDKRFLPGLEFEYHLGIPPLLRRIEPQAAPVPIDLTPQDISQALILWSVFGTFGHPDGGPLPNIEDLKSQPSLAAWRVLHDLEPGPVGAFLAPYTPNGPLLSLDEQDEVNSFLRGEENIIRRNPDSTLRFAVIVGHRADYLRDGVIDPNLYEPGDLTRSLCAPWQYDFADCGCFYWASNKPDMVAAEPDGDQLYNFQRIRHPSSEPPSGGPGTTPEERQRFLTISGWSQDTMGHRSMVEDWETLPVVLNAEEATEFTPEVSEVLPDDQVLSREEVVSRLQYLASVEHGLMVEYLYAHYSINAPRTAPGTNLDEQRLFGIGRVVLGVAIDEMRHFRWVNEILRELGASTVVDRVDSFEDIDNNNRFIPHHFSLEPLNDQRLQWFVDVERPSKYVDPSLANDTIDGMYTRLLLSIRQNAEFEAEERKRLIHLIKLIIDEGYDHFSRFVRAQMEMAQVSTLQRTRLGAAPTPLPAGHPAKVAEITVDRAYSVVLTTLKFVFAGANARNGDLLQAARYAMYALDDAAHEVIRLGGAPLFTLPEFVSEELTAAAIANPEQALRGYMVEGVAQEMDVLLGQLRESGSSDAAESIARNYERLKTAVLEEL
ncbi:ferritin-like domain-containing protein [Parasphingorhabdus sp.]|uniref:ferritin-like domain-containing protein n=1 Tax=Parasphingorhabdus sp. TaxID=2709688 RepID=UPI003594150E